MIEYLTRKVAFGGTLQPRLPEIDAMLAELGRDDWALVQVLPSTAMGTSWEALFVFRRDGR